MLAASMFLAAAAGAAAQATAIERVPLWQANVAPGGQGRATVVLDRDPGTASGQALHWEIRDLRGRLLAQQTRTIAGQYLNLDFPAGLPEGGHRLRLELLEGGVILDAKERVYSVVTNPADDIRYGFYANFGSATGDFLAKTDILVDCYINAIEYYDWFPAHGDYTPEQDLYEQQPFGQLISLNNLQQKLEQARAKRIQNIAYIAAYAGIPSIVNAIPRSNLTNEAGNWIAFYEGNVGPDIFLDDVWFYLTAFAPDTPWRDHLWQELTGVLDGTGTVIFDGFEIDTYGWNEPYYSEGSSFNGTPMRQMLAQLTGDVRALTRQYRPEGMTALNAIAEVGIEDLYNSSDFLFTENWAFHKPRYDEVARMVRQHAARSGMRLISKCYPADLEGNFTVWPAPNLRYLMGAHLLGGGSFMVAGEPREETGQIGGLNSLYYPDNQPQPQENFDIIQQYNAHDAALYTWNHGPGVEAIAVDLDVAGAMANGFRASDGSMTYGLLRLGQESHWTRPSQPPESASAVAVELVLPNGFVPEDLLFGTPDAADLVFPRSIPWSQNGRSLSCTLPRLDTYATLIVPARNLHKRVVDAAADPAYASAWGDAASGGIGWTSEWEFSGRTPTANLFIGESWRNGDGAHNLDADIDTDGRSWGLFSGQSGLVDARRSFPALRVGESLRFHMDTGMINTGGAVGFSLMGAGQTPLMEWFFRGGDPFHRLADVRGETLSQTEFTDEGLDLELTRTGESAFQLRVVPIGNQSATRTYGGTFTQTPAAEMKARFFSFAAGTGPEHDAFFNDISVYRLLEGTDTWLAF